MSAYFYNSTESIDEMLDQIRMETAPWAEAEKKNEKTSIFESLNCTEEPSEEDNNSVHFGQSREDIKTSVIHFDYNDCSSSPFEDDSIATSRETFGTKLSNTRSSIFHTSEEPIPFKFISVLDQSSDFFVEEEPERNSMIEENVAFVGADTDTSDSEIEDVIEIQCRPLLKLESPRCVHKPVKKSHSKKIKKIFSRIKRAFGIRNKEH